MSFGEKTFDSNIECTLNKLSSHRKEMQKYLGMITRFIYIYIHTHIYTYMYIMHTLIFIYAYFNSFNWTLHIWEDLFPSLLSKAEVLVCRLWIHIVRYAGHYIIMSLFFCLETSFVNASLMITFFIASFWTLKRRFNFRLTIQIPLGPDSGMSKYLQAEAGTASS